MYENSLGATEQVAIGETNLELPIPNDSNLSESNNTNVNLEQTTNEPSKQNEISNAIEQRLARQKRAHMKEVENMREQHKQEMEQIRQQLNQQGVYLQQNMAPQWQPQRPLSEEEQVMNFVDSRVMAIQNKIEEERQQLIATQNRNEITNLQNRYNQDLQNKIEEGYEKYSDFGDAVDLRRFPKDLVEYAKHMPNPEDVLYRLSKEPDLVNKFNTINPMDTYARGKLIAKVSQEAYADNISRFKSKAEPPIGSPKSSTPPPSYGEMPSDPTSYRLSREKTRREARRG